MRLSSFGTKLPSRGPCRPPRTRTRTAPPHGGDIGAELRARLARELRDGFVSRAVALPLGSQEALARVAYLCRLQGSTRAEIARAAAADASFAAALLRISNSAASAGRYPITNLPAAVTRLGTRMVRMLAVAAPTLRLLAAEDDGLVAVRREIHRHSIRVGVLARELAPPSIYAETALAAGLVHNVGLGVLSLYGEVGLRRTIELATPERPFGDIEPDVFGFTHAELGGVLGRAWKYPDALVIAIGDHDREMPSTPLAALVAVADLLVRRARRRDRASLRGRRSTRQARRARSRARASEGSAPAARRRGRAARREERERRLLGLRPDPRLRQPRARGVAAHGAKRRGWSAPGRSGTGPTRTPRLALGPVGDRPYETPAVPSAGTYSRP